MPTIQNITAISAEKLYLALKTDFATYADEKLDSGLTVEFAHVEDVINVTFPDIIAGIAFSVVVSDKQITVTENNVSPEYNSGLLEDQLIGFLKIKAG